MSNQSATRVGNGSSPATGSWAVAAVGVCLAAFGSWHVVATMPADGAADWGWTLFINIALPLAVGAAVVVVTRGTRSKDRIILRWVVGGIVGLGLLGVWASLDAILAGELASARSALVLAANLGIMFGAIAGINRSKAVQNAELAERERAQRKGLTLLNHLLRHHVLNGMTIINGYTDELREEDISPEHVEVIERQSERIVTLVENVQVLVQSLSGELEPKPVDLEGVVEAAVADTSEMYPRATFDVETEPATVLANDLVRSVLDNLLVNAVEHHDADATVEVTVAAGDPVVLRIADDGPGIPEDVLDSFEADDDLSTGIAGEGMGLYLVHTLVRSYGGSVSIERRDPRGTVVTVELPRA